MRYLKHLLFLLLFLLSVTDQLKAQTDNCGTEPLDSVSFESQPWFGNNEYLIDLLDSLGYGSGENLNEGGFDSQVKYWIPIRAWVYHDDAGVGGASVNEVENRIRQLNDVFSGRHNEFGQAHPHTMIQFYLTCDITYINQSSMAFNCSDNTRQQAWNYNFQQGVMNVHFVQTHNTWGGIARPPGYNNPFGPYQPFVCAIVNNASTSTLAHEIGHNLGLSHTHYTRGSNPINKDANDCYQESVSRTREQGIGCLSTIGIKKCAVNGDALCDTEADPMLEEQVEKVSDVWTYIGGGTDNWDVSWNPNVFNIMSYSPGSVKEYFSPMQIAVMLHWALSIPHPYGYLNPKLNTSNSFIDVFEPDNYRSTNNESIAFETVQHRGLHKVITGQPVSLTETYCDQDYIKFVVPVGSTYKINIFTEAVTGRPQVNTEIFLIKIESGVEVVLASNDNKNQENLYSEIMEFEIGEGTYWIKVQSKNNTTGEYNLHLERCKVECCQNYLIGSVTEININTGNFNEGVKSGVFSEEFFGKSVSVNGANFGCNIDFPLGIGGHAYPTTNSMLQLDICNEAEIDVINGSFILGDQGTGRKAQVKLNAGTILKIRDKLIINNNSKLILDAGAKLIYEHGASIELLGTNSIIEIQDGGLIEIGNGATFTWSGKGYLKVNNDPYDLGKVNIKAAAGATNAKFIKQGEWVSGEGYIEKLIEVETGTLSFDRSIAEVNVKYGVIELGYEAFVDVEPICYFDNVTFQSNASNQMHNGLWIYGQQNTPYVSGCLFKNALRGITVYPLVKGVGVTLGNEPISYKSAITNTVFKDCHQSIYINARGAEITNCQITGIGDHPGVRLRGIQYKSFIDKLTARNQAIGIDLLGSGQNEVSVRRSNIHNNGTAGIYGTNVKLSLGCDKIYENYSTSFQGQNIWLANGSHFIAQNTLSHGSRLNDLHSTNSTSVFLDNVFGIHIDNGFNNFVSNGYAIWGSIIPYQVTNNPSQYESIKVVYGQNNYWNTQGASPQFGDYAVVYNDGWTYYLTHIDDIGQSLSTAPNLTENCSYGTISNDPPSMFLGKAPLFDPNGVPLDEVWIEARDFMNEGNFSQAYDRFNDIVSYNYDTSFTIMGTSDIYTSEFREWYDVIQMAYSKMIECINQSVALGQIDANTYELDGIFSVQDNLLAKLGSNDTLNTELKFEYNFDKAMLYRLTNKQTLCLTKITNMLSHAHISAQNIKLLNYYACLVEKENRMLNDSTLTKAEYFQVFDCDTLLEIPNMGPPDYQEEKTGVAENTHSIANQEINLYPNPAKDYLFVSLVKPASNIQVNVFDLMGKLIVSKEIKENTQLIQMPLDMSDGSYIMQITTDNYTARKRFMVVK